MMHDVPVCRPDEIVNTRDNVKGREYHGQTNGDQQDPKPRRPLDQFKDTGTVAFADDVEKSEAGKTPPWITRDAQNTPRDQSKYTFVGLEIPRNSTKGKKGGEGGGLPTASMVHKA